MSTLKTGYSVGGPQAITRIDNNIGDEWCCTYNGRGDLDNRYKGTMLTHDYIFDVEIRLVSLTTDS